MKLSFLKTIFFALFITLTNNHLHGISKERMQEVAKQQQEAIKKFFITENELNTIKSQKDTLAIRRPELDSFTDNGGQLLLWESANSGKNICVVDNKVYSIEKALPIEDWVKPADRELISSKQKEGLKIIKNDSGYIIFLNENNIYQIRKPGTKNDTPQLPQGMEVKAVYSAKLELPKVDDSNYRTKIIDEELAKVKIPTEETDHLLALEIEQEKMQQESKKKLVTPEATPTNIVVNNQSKFAIGCAITALHTTPEKTSLFSRKYKKYITQTTVSEMVIIKPKSSKVINLNTAGINIAKDETVITLMVDCMQVTSKKHVKTETEKKDGVFYTKVNEAILVTDVTTTSWLSNGKKKILLNQQTSLEFPTDFAEALSSVESHEGMNYYNLIAYMRACERIYEYAAEQVQFPPSYFDPQYISKLPPKELDNVYQFIMKQFNRKFIPMPVGLTGLINCGKYNFVAKGLAQIALSIVMLFVPGAQASIASDVASIIETIVDNSMAIGQGVEALNAKNKKI